jgi:hypothetical protein
VLSKIKIIRSFAFGQLFSIIKKNCILIFIKKKITVLFHPTIMSLVKLSIKEFHTVKHKTDLRFELNEVDGDRNYHCHSAFELNP